jgi:putative transposase
MGMRRYKPEQVVTLLRQIEVGIANGKATPQACKEAEITVQTYYRWRKEYGGLKLDQARRFSRQRHEAHARPCSFYFGDGYLSRFCDGYLDRVEGGSGVLARFEANGILIKDLVILAAKHHDEGLEEHYRRVGARTPGRDASPRQRQRAARTLRAAAAILRLFPARMALGVRRLPAEITVSETLKEMSDGGLDGPEVAVWLEDSAQVLDEIGPRPRKGRPLERRKVDYRRGWIALAYASGLDEGLRFELGAIAFNATFGTKETARTFQHRCWELENY